LAHVEDVAAVIGTLQNVPIARLGYSRSAHTRCASPNRIQPCCVLILAEPGDELDESPGGKPGTAEYALT
jgi:hypothetical protein